jgi:hypothetical protein
MAGVEEFIDASLFLGMHSPDEAIRIACKNFFIERVRGVVVMSLEQVGKCDAIVWQHERALQDAYYPFMDNLHTIMRIERTGYSEADVRLAITAPHLQALSMTERLMIAMVLNRKGTLYTVDDALLRQTGLPIQAPKGGPEIEFSGDLEQLYKQSLALRLPWGEVSR